MNSDLTLLSYHNMFLDWKQFFPKKQNHVFDTLSQHCGVFGQSTLPYKSIERVMPLDSEHAHHQYHHHHHHQKSSNRLTNCVKIITASSTYLFQVRFNESKIGHYCLGDDQDRCNPFSGLHILTVIFMW